LNTNTSFETFQEGENEKSEKVYFQVFKFPVENFNKKRLIGGQAVDITSKVKDKLQMIKEKYQFQSFMENAPILAWIIDEDGVLMYMNTLCKNLLITPMKTLVIKLANILPLLQKKKFYYLNLIYLPIINACNFYMNGLMITEKPIITELINFRLQILMANN
jgi:hypothetical protein